MKVEKDNLQLKKKTMENNIQRIEDLLSKNINNKDKHEFIQEQLRLNIIIPEYKVLIDQIKELLTREYQNEIMNLPKSLTAQEHTDVSEPLRCALEIDMKLLDQNQYLRKYSK